MFILSITGSIVQSTLSFPGTVVTHKRDVKVFPPASAPPPSDFESQTTGSVLQDFLFSSPTSQSFPSTATGVIPGRRAAAIWLCDETTSAPLIDEVASLPLTGTNATFNRTAVGLWNGQSYVSKKAIELISHDERYQLAENSMFDVGITGSIAFLTIFRAPGVPNTTRQIFGKNVGATTRILELKGGIAGINWTGIGTSGSAVSLNVSETSFWNGAWHCALAVVDRAAPHASQMQLYTDLGNATGQDPGDLTMVTGSAWGIGDIRTNSMQIQIAYLAVFTGSNAQSWQQSEFDNFWTHGKDPTSKVTASWTGTVFDTVYIFGGTGSHYVSAFTGLEATGLTQYPIVYRAALSGASQTGLGLLGGPAIVNHCRASMMTTGSWQPTTGTVFFDGPNNVQRDPTGMSAPVADLPGMSVSTRPGGVPEVRSKATVGAYCRLPSASLGTLSGSTQYTLSFWATSYIVEDGVPAANLPTSSIAVTTGDTDEVLAFTDFRPDGSWKRFSLGFTANPAQTETRILLFPAGLGRIAVSKIWATMFQISQGKRVGPCVRTTGSLFQGTPQTVSAFQYRASGSLVLASASKGEVEVITTFGSNPTGSAVWSLGDNSPTYHRLMMNASSSVGVSSAGTEYAWVSPVVVTTGSESAHTIKLRWSKFGLIDDPLVKTDLVVDGVQSRGAVDYGNSSTEFFRDLGILCHSGSKENVPSVMRRLRTFTAPRLSGST